MEYYHRYAYPVANRFTAEINKIDEDTFFYATFLNHAIITANIVFRNMKELKRENKITQIPLLAGLLFMLAAGLGGSILNSLLTARPMIFLEMDVIILFFFVTWILIAFTPGQILHHLTGNPLVELVTYAIQGLFVGTHLVAAVNNGVELFPSRVFAPIILGTLSSIGGLILKPIFLNMYLGYQYEFTILGIPNVDLLIPFSLTIFYFVTKHFWNISVYTVEILPDIQALITPEFVVKVVMVVYYLWFWLSYRVIGLKSGRKPAVQNPSLSSSTAPVTAIRAETSMISNVKKNN